MSKSVRQLAVPNETELHSRRNAVRSPAIYDLAKGDLDLADAVVRLENDGVIVFRNAFPKEQIDAIAERSDALLSKPSIAGTYGYAKVDHPKRLANPMQIGRPFIDLATDARIINVVEMRMGSECVLAEFNLKLDEPVGYSYFALHADFSAGWRKSATSKITLTAEDLKQPVGIGGVLYLHDTTSGAFCYCLGTHTLGAPRGPDLSKYPKAEQDQIKSTNIRLDGQKGDLVLFDDRGFHGPDQPATARRIVILLDYYRVKTFGFSQVSPLQIYTSDLGGITAKQMRVLGFGAEPMVPPEQYLLTKFGRNRWFGLSRRIVENAYLGVHLRQKIKHRLGRS